MIRDHVTGSCDVQGLLVDDSMIRHHGEDSTPAMIRFFIRASEYKIHHHHHTDDLVVLTETALGAPLYV